LPVEFRRLGASHVHRRLGHTADLFFAAASMAIAVPTGVKVFNWIATMWGGSIRFTTAMCFAIAFIIQFVVGGLSGITFAVAPVDWQMHNTYYVVAHFHYVLFGGTLFGMLAGLYYWFPKMSGRLLSEKLGKWQFWLTVIGFNLTFFVQHLLGFHGHAAAGLHLSRSAGVGRGQPALDLRRFHSWFRDAVAGSKYLWSLRRGQMPRIIPGTPGRWNGPRPRRRPRTISTACRPSAAAVPLWDLAHPDQTDRRTRRQRRPANLFPRRTRLR
jgi:hypothetical protein